MAFQVYKIHSDFYWVKGENQEYICKTRELLKKQKSDIAVGDFVELSEDFSFINSIKKRKNSLLRPKVSNIDTAIVVASILEPELDLVQLNRYLIYLKYNKINTIICFNKSDLLQDKTFKYDKIYKKLGYKTFIISAKEQKIPKEFLKEIKGKTIVLQGMSGVGKSTLINTLSLCNLQKTGEISKKTQKGCHTTRHVEIIEYQDFKIIDTPGFSNLKFDFILPNELIDLFEDLNKYKNECKYSNCLHNSYENNTCGIIKNLDKIEKSRYESYLCFLKEAQSYKEKISKTSIKIEHSTKNSGNKTLTKISKNKRIQSRKASRQNLSKEKNGEI